MTITSRTNLVVPSLFAFFFAAGTLEAQFCSEATTAGKYFVVCDGYLSPAPNAPLVPAKILATSVSDVTGQIKGTGTASIAGKSFRS